MVFMKCMIVLLMCLSQGQSISLRKRRQTNPQESLTAASSQQPQQQQPTSQTTTGGTAADPQRHERLVNLLLQAQQNIAAGNQNQNQVPAQPVDFWNQEQIIYLRNLVKLLLQTRLTNMFQRTPQNYNRMGGMGGMGSMGGMGGVGGMGGMGGMGRRRGVNTNVDGRDRTVFTPYGRVTYDGNDVSYDMEY